MRQIHRLRSQRGASLFGMVIIAIVVGFFMLMGARVFPAVNEYLTIRRAVSQIMKQNPATPSDVRNLFERTSEVEYSIHTITAKDLVIAQVGDKLRTSYAYNVEIPIVEPVFMLIKFEGSAVSGGGNLP